MTGLSGEFNGAHYRSDKVGHKSTIEDSRTDEVAVILPSS